MNTARQMYSVKMCFSNEDITDMTVSCLAIDGTAARDAVRDLWPKEWMAADIVITELKKAIPDVLSSLGD